MLGRRHNFLVGLGDNETGETDVQFRRKVQDYGLFEISLASFLEKKKKRVMDRSLLPVLH